MAKLSPGLRKDWKDRSQTKARPAKRKVRLAVVGGLFVLLLGAIALQRLGRPEDIGPAVRFLAGPGASYITGQVLVVDGGMVM
jgi:NAD(P)-dependent dehydrogenase (short-subunit alcohol dehydrogenase family)